MISPGIRAYQKWQWGSEGQDTASGTRMGRREDKDGERGTRLMGQGQQSNASPSQNTNEIVNHPK